MADKGGTETAKRAQRLDTLSAEADGMSNLPPSETTAGCEGCETARAALVQAAKDRVGLDTWAYDADRPPYGPGTSKCNLFVYETANAAGATVPMMTRWSWRHFGHVEYPPLAGQWADPNVEIPGWVIVSDPRPGDIAAEAIDYADATGHVGIVTGEGTTVSATSDTVIENDWGFRAGQNVVFRRYVGT